MTNISQNVNIEMLEKLPDGTYKRKYPKTRSDTGVTFDEHLAESAIQYGELKFSELSSTATNLDSEGIYVNAEWKRKDGTVYAKSTLLGATPSYNQIKIDYYNKLGTTIEKSITWDLTYDENDFIYKKVVF